MHHWNESCKCASKLQDQVNLVEVKYEVKALKLNTCHPIRLIEDHKCVEAGVGKNRYAGVGVCMPAMTAKTVKTRMLIWLQL